MSNGKKYAKRGAILAGGFAGSTFARSVQKDFVPIYGPRAYKLFLKPGIPAVGISAALGAGGGFAYGYAKETKAEKLALKQAKQAVKAAKVAKKQAKKMKRNARKRR